jgi:hypothetical protein
MQIAAATDGSGKLTLECDDTTGSKESGVLIRSLGNAAFTGHNMYIGINKGDSRTTNRLETPGTPGSLILDAGANGSILERSKSHQVDTTIFTALTSGDKNTAITISGNMIGLFAEVVVAPTSLNMSVLDGTQKIGVVRNGVEEQVLLDVDSSPAIAMKEAVFTDGNIKITGNFICNNMVIAKQVGYVSGGEIVDNGKIFTPLTVQNTKLNKNLETNSGSALVTELAQTIYQDFYIASNCFQFPENYGVEATIVIPGMVWQETTRELVGDIATVAWEEKPITVPGEEGNVTTACYPGWEAWSGEAKITQAGYKKEPLNKNYITNTEKENSNA